jgi:hypothetical protein
VRLSYDRIGPCPFRTDNGRSLCTSILRQAGQSKVLSGGGLGGIGTSSTESKWKKFRSGRREAEAGGGGGCSKADRSYLPSIQ